MSNRAATILAIAAHPRHAGAGELVAPFGDHTVWDDTAAVTPSPASRIWESAIAAENLFANSSGRYPA